MADTWLTHDCVQAVLSGGPVIKNLPRADLLPVALYVLCSQLAAAKDALGLPIAVSISGHAEEAESLAEASVAEGPEQGSDPALKKRKLPSSGDLYKVSLCQYGVGNPSISDQAGS